MKLLYAKGMQGRVKISTLAQLLARCTPDGTGCLMYPKTAHRYGIVSTTVGRFTTHHAAFLLAGNSLKPGQMVCHSCDKPGCCNLDHLWAGTSAENQRDRRNKGRHRGNKPLNPLPYAKAA